MNTKGKSPGLSARTLMAISRFTFPHARSVGNSSGVIAGLSQQLRRGEPDGPTAVRVVYCSKIIGAQACSQEMDREGERSEGEVRGRGICGARGK